MRLSVPPLRYRHRCLGLCQVPLSPDAIAQLYSRFIELKDTGRLPKSMGFEQYYAVWRSGRRAKNLRGLDDGATDPKNAIGKELIARPNVKLAGAVRTVVLLVDFEDQPKNGNRSAAFYEQMLFSTDDVFPSGSMREYFRQVSAFDATSNHGIDVQGQVFGWFRMPHPYAFYTDGNSGMGENFPRNAPGMVRDAVQAALEAGIDFKPFNMLGENTVTALFVVHAGSGAEKSLSKDDIWSHKWNIPGGMKVGPNLEVATYLTVPEDCNMGVCAHEWGHLAARWADYYDTGTVKHMVSNGLGDYCLMAAGSWGQNGLTPVFPNGMLRMFHDWTVPRVINKSTADIELKPAAEGGGMLYVSHPTRMVEQQYIVIEYRRKRGQDAFLPDEGIAIYVVDERLKDVNNEGALAIELLQADGQQHLAQVFGQGNRGGPDDLYPTAGNSRLDQTSKPPLNMPDGAWSGVSIDVAGVPGQDSMKVSITFD